jgi:general secretion pathway protein C
VITQIRRPYWIATHLLLLAAAAYFAASAVSTVVRGRLGRTHVATGALAAAPTSPSIARPLADYLTVTRRDLFAAVPTTERSTAVEPTRRGPSTLRLLGTGRHGDEVYAVIEDTQAKRQDLVTVGQKLGDAEVVRIGYRRVVLRRGGEEEVLEVAAEPTGANTSGPAPVPAVAAAPAPAAGDDQIRRIGDDRYLISRGEVDHSLDNLSELFTQVRAVPNLENGKTTGFRLFAIRQGSLFEKIGLNNNDVVQRINGIDLNDPARAMSLFQELQGQSRLTVDVLRGGETRTLSYEIR